MHLTKGQRFKTNKGVFTIVGVWWNNGEVKSYEVKNLVTNTMQEVSLDEFRAHEKRITYITPD